MFPGPARVLKEYLKNSKANRYIKKRRMKERMEKEKKRQEGERINK